MKIEPHIPVDLRQESFFCDGDNVLTYDGASTPESELENSRSPFMKFLKGLDPNKTFIVGYLDIENSRAKSLYYKARKVALNSGIHMQSDVLPFEEQLQRWQTYKKMKSMKSAENARNG
jgi:hypothetical protein